MAETLLIKCPHGCESPLTLVRDGEGRWIVYHDEPPPRRRMGFSGGTEPVPEPTRGEDP